MLNGIHDRVGLGKHHHPIDLIAEANALLSGFALYPQLFKVITTHQSGDLAPTTFLIMSFTNIIWHIYGWHRRTLPVIISSALSGTAGLLLFILSFHYKG